MTVASRSVISYSYSGNSSLRGEMKIGKILAFAFLASLVSLQARAQVVPPPGAPESCVPITDCNSDGVDDDDPDLSPQYCSNPDHVCIDDGTCRPKADGFCRVDADCELPKICDRNLCKDAAPGPADGAAVNPIQDAAEAVTGMPQGPCPYGFYKNSSNACERGCSTDEDCGFRSLPNDRRCRVIPFHSVCVAHLHTCATSGECTLKCKPVYHSEDDTTTYEWKGQGGRDVRCIPKLDPPACTAANEGAAIEGLITRY